MSNPKEPSLYRLQKVSKPKIEDIIAQTLVGDRKENALEFVSYVKSFPMTPSWASANSWAVNYKGKRVCYIKINDDVCGNASWHIRPAIKYNKDLIEFCRTEQYASILLENVHFCRACGKCAPGKQKMFFGKVFEGCCRAIDFDFYNPDLATLEFAKKLVVFCRNIIEKKHT